MSNILDKIVEKKRIELAESKRLVSYDEILKKAKAAPVGPSFFTALKIKNGNPAIIAELKKASPSMGIIRADFKPVELAASLENAGASALSVLTEKNFFLGGMQYLKDASVHVKIPILRKDFIFDKYQLCEAKAWGASAALLIAAMLDRDELKCLMAFADSIGLEILVETHSQEELDIALNSGAKIVGVNSRNLKTFEFDFTLFSKLIEKIPDSCIAVAESGVSTRENLLEAAKAGADAALVGTALMNKPFPSDELKKLLGNYES